MKAPISWIEDKLFFDVPGILEIIALVLDECYLEADQKQMMKRLCCGHI